MLADRWVMTSRCGGLELYKYKFGQHGAAEHREDNICFDLCNAYMTVYTTMQGGDAVRIPAAVFSEEQSCGSAAKKRRRSPSPRARRRPAATRALPAQKGA